jgi:TldD protein
VRDLTHRALDLARTQGATYADIRIIEQQTQSIAIKNGVVEHLVPSTSRGFGVRVVVDGAWGFAASAKLAAREVVRVTAEAVRIARASVRVKTASVDLGPPEAH